jgi:hypothetical protein
LIVPAPPWTASAKPFSAALVEMLLPLRELRPFARLVLPVFLALDDATVARQKALLL